MRQSGGLGDLQVRQGLPFQVAGHRRGPGGLLAPRTACRQIQGNRNDRSDTMHENGLLSHRGLCRCSIEPAASSHEKSLNCLLEFTDVPGPRVAFEPSARVGRPVDTHG